eukprot:TRINITY_DN14776_c0_g1_i1.p1 TRINITY_DN14776_c0_g1~~TRINITY_DN14776_c0_g1_i1.p1  ORF type:complete len:316 (-),score=129.46 TRINITY_DN14776_c0_g1_i1:123-1043(-)
MAEVDVKETLEIAEKKFPSITPAREDNLKYDLGNLLAFDYTPVDAKALKENPSKYLQESARDCVQLLFNKLFQLPTERDGPDVFATLPKAQTVLPREKRIPVPKPPTKWEQFAKLKGITKKKRSRMVYDDAVDGQLRPRWGYGRAGPAQDQIIEARPGDDPTVDPFEAQAAKKKLAKTKQLKREAANRKANIRRERSALPSTISLTNAPEGTRKQKPELEHALKVATQSTISMGKFNKLLPGQKPIKPRKQLPDLGSEKNQSMKVLGKLLGASEGTINVDKAVGKEIHAQQKERSQQPKPKRMRKK